ncbi:MAG: UDP-N-acetylmuramoyl-L-alanyl-D-glutamate--2,6-diaminopimelate ligase [Betaproteobacteria bacterium]|nr:UDP-N-acetylmuramoyl-L-alanyl-D-glutamate--2,6-diaminopimelate ligase [Betaproteobacteria bacterium]
MRRRHAPAGAVDWKAVDALGITRLACDSRAVGSGDTFVAYPGSTRDGRAYITDAIAHGAVSVLWERKGFKWDARSAVSNLAVPNLCRHVGEIASRVYSQPSRRLWVVGVTGTNGKTTCSQWVAQALSAAGRRCAVLGTLGYGLRPPLRPMANTTPDAVWLHSQLAEFARRGAQAVSMEASSIGLDQDRVAGVEFDVALFTNLSRDHLEYHRTMRRYGEAKAKLFAWDSLQHAVVNLDDDFGVNLAGRIRRPGLKVIGYGFGGARATRAIRVAGGDVRTDTSGLSFSVNTPWGSAQVVSPVLGRFNASNLLGTLAVLLASGVTLRRAVAALARLKPLPGRMQRVGGGVKPLVVVDYAHTPDALEKVLLALRELQHQSRVTRNESRLICVFGCGGDRDRGKRPQMGRIAVRLADSVVVTSDNPRSEDPHAIIVDILEGARRGNREFRVNVDRRDAIWAAIASAQRGDIVLVAGKGHENFQEFRGVKHPFSDVAVAREALAACRPGSGDSLLKEFVGAEPDKFLAKR